MKLEAWKTGVKKHIPALEVFLKNVLLRKCAVEIEDTATGSNEDAADALEDASIIVRAVEEQFETEILFAFNSPWKPLLSKAILDVEEAQNTEFTKDLFKEFVTHLLQMVGSSFKEIGVELKIGEVDTIREGQLKRSLNLQKYLTTMLSVSPKFDMSGEQMDEPLKFYLAMAHPNKDKGEMLEVGFTDGNPFLDGSYVEISSGKAGHIDLNRVEKNPPDSAENDPESNINVKGERVQFEDFDKSATSKNNREVRNINMLKNVEMNLSVELGRREMPLGKILKLVKGSVIELEKLAGEPVEILVNGHMIAQGDVVVIDEHFGVRISNLIATQEHLKELS